MAQASSPREPPGRLAAVDIVAAAGELRLILDEKQGERLSRFAALLARWNAVHNLTTIDTPGLILTHHLLDSLAIVPPIERIVGDRSLTVLDVGAGGGLPGIPLAIARPNWQLTLLDKVQKKVAFLTQARVELALSNVECRHARAEDLQAGPFEWVVARAFAPLAELVRVSRHLLAPGGWWAAMKGVVPRDELAELAHAAPDVRVVDIVKLEVPRLAAERHLILLQRP